MAKDMNESTNIFLYKRNFGKLTLLFLNSKNKNECVWEIRKIEIVSFHCFMDQKCLFEKTGKT